MTISFDLTDTQREITESVRQMMRRFPDQYWAEKEDKHEFPHEFYQAFVEAGFLGAAIPQEYGGSGLGLTLAQTFITQHHGMIECDSVPGLSLIHI